MDIEKIIKEVKQIEEQSEFIVSWFAKKYQKTIRRVGHLNKDGCRTWEDYKGNKLCLLTHFNHLPHFQPMPM